MHSSKSVFVPLELELRQVENYIALELLRYEDRIQIDSFITGNSADHSVGPMILITLIENAFKHGVMNSTGKSWIRMKVECSTDRIEVTVRNSWKKTESGNGIGLENLKSQLDHLYPGKHSLDVNKSEPNQFSVNLVLIVK